MKYLFLFLFVIAPLRAEVVRFGEHGFSLELPSRAVWALVESTDNENPAVSVRAWRPEDDSCAVSLMVGDNVTGVTDLVEYARRWADGFARSGGKIVAKGDAELDGISAVHYTTEVAVEDHSVIQQFYLALYGGKVCVLGLITETNSEVRLLTEVFASVRIEKSNGEGP